MRDTLIFFINAENNYMRKIIEIFKYYSDRRFSTIAGTLVYFLLMSITPFILWLTLILGNVDINFERILSHELFESISPLLRYLKEAAESAAKGAGIILLATTLYSSTNFFYHLRRSGEIIYNSFVKLYAVLYSGYNLLYVFNRRGVCSRAGAQFIRVSFQTKGKRRYPGEFTYNRALARFFDRLYRLYAVCQSRTVVWQICVYYNFSFVVLRHVELFCNRYYLQRLVRSEERI